MTATLPTDYIGRFAPSPTGLLHIKTAIRFRVKEEVFLIIDTVPYTHDANPYLPTLKLDGTLVFVGLIGQTETALNTVPLVMQRRTVAGSLIGGIAETQELLDFCGKHNITADVELINMADINATYERMLKSDVKYRFVIDIVTL